MMEENTEIIIFSPQVRTVPSVHLIDGYKYTAAHGSTFDPLFVPTTAKLLSLRGKLCVILSPEIEAALLEIMPELEEIR